MSTYQQHVMVCDVCRKKTEWQSGTYGGGIAALGWFKLTQIDGRNSGERHLCSAKCLRDYAEMKPLPEAV